MVEHYLAKVGVASSSLVSRSKKKGKPSFPFCLVDQFKSLVWVGFARHGMLDVVPASGAIAKRLCSGLQSRLGRFDSGSRLQDSKKKP